MNFRQIFHHLFLPRNKASGTAITMKIFFFGSGRGYLNIDEIPFLTFHYCLLSVNEIKDIVYVS